MSQPTAKQGNSKRVPLGCIFGKRLQSRFRSPLAFKDFDAHSAATRYLDQESSGSSVFTGALFEIDLEWTLQPSHRLKGTQLYEEFLAPGCCAGLARHRTDLDVGREGYGDDGAWPQPHLGNGWPWHH